MCYNTVVFMECMILIYGIHLTEIKMKSIAKKIQWSACTITQKNIVELCLVRAHQRGGQNENFFEVSKRWFALKLFIIVFVWENSTYILSPNRCIYTNKHQRKK